MAALTVEQSSLRSALGRSSKTYSMSLCPSLFTMGRIQPRRRRALAPPALPKSHILQRSCEMVACRFEQIHNEIGYLIFRTPRSVCCTYFRVPGNSTVASLTHFSRAARVMSWAVKSDVATALYTLLSMVASALQAILLRILSPVDSSIHDCLAH